MPHVLEAAGVGTIGQIVFAVAAAVWLGTITSVLVEPGLSGGRKLMWCVLAFVPFLGGVLWLATGRSRAGARSSHSESSDSEAPEAEPSASERRSPGAEPARSDGSGAEPGKAESARSGAAATESRAALSR